MTFLYESFGATLGIVFAAGILATIGMSGLLTLLTRKNMPVKELLRALGGVFTTDEKTGITIGALLHIIPGIVFAYLYLLVFINLGQVDSFASSMVAGFILGIFHGSAVAFLMVIGVAEHDKFEKYRQYGFVIAVVYLAGHIFYGFLVGVISGAIMYA